ADRRRGERPRRGALVGVHVGTHHRRHVGHGVQQAGHVPAAQHGCRPVVSRRGGEQRVAAVVPQALVDVAAAPRQVGVVLRHEGGRQPVAGGQLPHGVLVHHDPVGGGQRVGGGGVELELAGAVLGGGGLDRYAGGPQVGHDRADDRFELHHLG